MTEEKYIRPTWDEYFMKIMAAVSARGTCDRGRASCVIVKDNRILATGYAGSPPGLPHCDEAGHLMIKSTEENDNTNKLHEHCVRTIHAEQNAIVHAARVGTALERSTIYVNLEPCPVCARLIIAAGIKRVVCKKRYHAANLTREMFSKVGIQLDVLNEEVEEYEK